ncbi:MAG: CDP-diacylglycerol--glycerol-3-phosphate 3-phosphatidyltransferase [Clostridia bacterium]|nr:CDP-diacylglycerol--glycerol-3-phosphate 3-phosphatidyltransferase [Clostridia bacterium]
MNLPNRLTMVRIALIPVTCALIALGLDVWAAAVFGAAALTDFLDGHIARKRGLVTAFGKFADPVADKLLVLTAMILLTERGLLPGWATVVVAARELIVDGLRMVSAGQGKVVAAKWPGKLKTVLQIVLVLALLLSGKNAFTSCLTVAAVAMTVVSGALYLRDFQDIFHDK